MLGLARVEGPLAVWGVSVVPLDSERILVDQTVVIEDGVILRVGPAGEVDRSGMLAVDGRDRFLLPALADMHMHLFSLSEAALFVANGVTLVRNMSGTPVHFAIRQKVDAGALPGPRIVTTSPLVDGVDAAGVPVWPGTDPLVDPNDSEALVGRYAERGYEQVKACSLLQPEALLALGQASARWGLPMTGHCPDAMTFEEAIDAGMRCFEHLIAIQNGHVRAGVEIPTRDHLAERLNAIAEHLDLDCIRTLARRMAQGDIWNCPTLTVMEGFAHDPEQARTNPLLRYEPESVIRSWLPENDFRFSETDLKATSAAQRRLNERMTAVVGILHQEGAPLLVGTDTPIPWVIEGFSVHDELAHFQYAGMSAYEAICCATVNPARFLGEDESRGLVKEGHTADLMLVRGNPLESLETLRQPEAVFCNGFFLPDVTSTACSIDACKRSPPSTCRHRPYQMQSPKPSRCGQVS